MSIATEISRLQTAKADIKTAIEAKGVTVPSSAKIDDYATLVGQIQTGGGSLNLTTLNVTPTTSAQQIIPTSPVDGYDEVNVAAVTSAIDNNITAGNIKKDVTILGVTGTLAGGFDLLGIKSGTKTTITKADGDYIAEILGYAICRYLFESTQVTSADYSGITSITRANAIQYLHSYCSHLTFINFDNITKINGDRSFQYAFQSCTQLTTISFPLLQSLTGVQVALNTFSGCSNLTSINFPSLTTISGTNALQTMFNNCSNLSTATVHPSALSNSTQNLNLLGSVTGSAFTTLRLSATATNNIYLSWAGYLDSDSILDVLNHLSTEATGKTCAFKNLTVASSDPNYSAISAKVSALTNWTITGLTI